LKRRPDNFWRLVVEEAVVGVVADVRGVADVEGQEPSGIVDCDHDEVFFAASWDRLSLVVTVEEQAT
jgi:hypothetical protein